MTLPRSRPVRSQWLLHATVLVCVFYSFKGLIGGAAYYWLGISGLSNRVNPATSGVTLLLILAAFLNRRTRLSTEDHWLLGAGLALFSLAILRGDYSYAAIVVLLLIVPTLLVNVRFADDRFVRRAVRVLFALTVLYIATEHVILHAHLYGIASEPIVSEDALSDFYGQLAFGGTEGEPITVATSDERFGVIEKEQRRIRTGGFLGHPLQMPVIIAMAATYFFIRWRRAPSVRGLLWMLLASFLLFNALSTTSLLAFLAAAALHEFLHRADVRRYVALGGLGVVLSILVTRITALQYLYSRFLLVLQNSDQMAFFPGPAWWSNPALLIVGRQAWSSRNAAWSENELLNVISAFGLVLGAAILIRLLRPAFQIRRIRSDDLAIYSYVVLTAVLCMGHREAVTTPNVLLIVTILNIKARDIVRQAQPVVVRNRHHALLAATPRSA